MRLCSHCKTPMMADTSKVLTSDPPMYLYQCPNCARIEYAPCSEAYERSEEELLMTKRAIVVGFLIGTVTFLGVKGEISQERMMRHLDEVLENHPEYRFSPKEKVKLIGIVQHIDTFIKEFSDDEIFKVASPLSKNFKDPNQLQEEQQDEGQ